MSIISANGSNSQLLARDFGEFLNQLPPGFTFSLWYVQGGMRFTRQGIPNYQEYADELNLARELGFIVDDGEDTGLTNSEWQEGYPPHLRAGLQFKRTRLKIKPAQMMRRRTD
jgi:hypothetical protein